MTEVGEGKDRPGGDGSCRLRAGGGFMMEAIWLALWEITKGDSSLGTTVVAVGERRLLRMVSDVGPATSDPDRLCSSV